MYCSCGGDQVGRQDGLALALWRIVDIDMAQKKDC